MKSSIRNLVLACSLIVTPFVMAEPPVAPFYESLKGVAPNGKLGQIIKQEKISTTVKGAQAWKIAYISSDVGERKTIVTGVIIAPVGPAPKEGRPIMAWAHGTTGAAQNCGPSQVINPTAPLNEYFLVGGNSWTDYGLPNVEEFIREGYVVVATDYQGLGGGGRHQYAVGGTNGRDLINSARAASSMKEVGAGKKVIGYGWSQGGGATIAAASLTDYQAKQGTAADNLQYLGFVGMAPDDVAVMVPGIPKDEAGANKIMSELIAMNATNVFDFGHLVMNLWGTQAAYSNLKLTDMLTEDGAKVIDEIISNKCMHVLADTINYKYGNQYKNVIQPQLKNNLAWVNAFVDGSVKPVKPAAPVVIYWGTKDTAVPPIMHKLYQKQMCGMGANVERIQLPGELTHYDTPPAAAPLYLQWVKDRIAGKPVGNGCQNLADQKS